MPKQPKKDQVEVIDAEVVDADVVDAEVVDGEVLDADSGEEELEAEGPSVDELDDVEVVDEPIVRRRPAATSSALSRRDPLAAYMRDVQRYPLLTREEEHALAVRYVQDGDLDAARRLVLSNLRLVVKIAYDYRQAYKNLLDLVQEGNMGLMQAVKKYDPYKGVKLSSYAAWWIRAYILRYILNNFRLVKLGTTQAQRKLFFNLQKEKSRLSALGIEPSPEKIADRLGVPVKDVVSMDRRLGASEASLDAPVGQSDGKPTPRVELMSGEGAPVDEVLAAEELDERLRAKIHEYGRTLKAKEKRIFEERLIADEPKTLQQLGDEFGVSRERVRQIEKRLLEKMKKFMEDQLGASVLDVYEAP
ncbi:MAG: RNA polymerase factor sigma-32 [Myxococcales bacterium]|nr:RNA polymerase factor sigma-32 [Myxococcales bacterium]